MADAPKLTKADTVALWHAVQWMDLCVRQGGKDDQGVEVESQRLAAAKLALRKVNAIRKASDGVAIPDGRTEEWLTDRTPSATE